MLAAAAKKHLCLVLQSAKGARMDNAVAIALKLGAPLRRFLGVVASSGVGAKLIEGAGDALGAELLEYGPPLFLLGTVLLVILLKELGHLNIKY